MRIKVINPNTMQAMTERIGETATKAARAGTQCLTVNPCNGPLTLEGAFDATLASFFILQEVLSDDEHYDAHVIACFGDPAVDAVREVTRVPVIGIGEAGLHVVSLLAPRFSIVTVLPRVLVELHQMVTRYGFDRRVASIRAANITVADMAGDSDGTCGALIEAGRRAISEDQAEAIVLGCAGMTGVDQAIEKALGVPVIDGVAAAVKLAELAVELGKTTSKINSYKYPEKKEIRGLDPCLKRTIATLRKG